jgi:hypothetical protein
LSELDLDLKVAARRLLWRMGYTTRLDVKLRSVVGAQGTDGATRTRRSATPDEFTDLDVLGLGFAGGTRLHSAIVDCKTSASGSTGRMFWVRGVADFFAADDAYMLRSAVVSDGARQLATRLGITALARDDLARMEDLHCSGDATVAAPWDRLFDATSASQVLHSFDSLDAKLKPLLEYRDFTYWVIDDYRNPIQLVEQLREAGPILDARNPLHLALVLDMAWLYLVCVAQMIHSIRTAYVSDTDRGLKEYLFGGPIGYREKEQLSQLLAGLKEAGAVPAQVNVDVLPTFFPRLRELVVRIMRRPDRMLPALRLLEVLTAVAALKTKVEPADLGPQYNEIDAKLAADVVGFLVTTCDLNMGLKNRARSLLLGEPVPV